MISPARRVRSLPRIAAFSVLALALPGLIATGAPVAQAESSGPAPAASPLSLRLPTKIEMYGDEPYLNYSLRANGAAFEIRAHRATYGDPITAEWIKADGNVPLPDGSISEWGTGLAKFVQFTVTRRKTGEVVRRWRADACLNSYNQQRVTPDADPRSPYPKGGCPYNPYTVGSVQGIQADWANTVDMYGNLPRIKPGKYLMTARVSQPYADLFGITGGDRFDTAPLEVFKDYPEEEPRVGRDDDLAEPAAKEPANRSGGRIAEPRPDLRSLPAFGIQLNKKKTQLRFGANVWNAGDSPLVVDGFREDDEEHMDAYQYFFDAEGNQVGYEYVGELHYHQANHNHWHFEDFARYTLVDQDKQDVVVSSKQSFCLANTDAVDYTVPGADWNPENTDLATACGDSGSLSLREVLSSGSGDTYYQFRAGQSFPIANLPNGTYFIKIQANPDDRLFEASKTNNISYRKVILKGAGANRRVVVPQVGVIDEGDLGGQRTR